jgi:hypothetical protein
VIAAVIVKIVVFWNESNDISEERIYSFFTVEENKPSKKAATRKGHATLHRVPVMMKDRRDLGN